MRTRVLLDCDGVLADFRTGALDTIEQVIGHRVEAETDWEIFGHLSDEHREKVFGIVRSAGWCADLKPYPEALEAVREIMERADVYIVTSIFRGSPTWTYDRTAWLAEHFGIGWQNIVFTNAKYLVQGDVFVDDKPAHVREWGKHFPEGNPVMWSRWLEERNSDMERYRTQDWGDVIRFVS